jgi:hypothetical protein
MTEELPRARKEHRCTECYRTIHIGENYELTKGCWDGSWSQFRTCMHCVSVRQWLDTVCNGWEYGGVYDETQEHYWDGYKSVGLARLLAGMRLKWHDGRDPIPDRTEVRALANRMMHEMVA